MALLSGRNGAIDAIELKEQSQTSSSIAGRGTYGSLQRRHSGFAGAA